MIRTRAQSSGGVPTGFAPGAHTISAAFAGDDLYMPASGTGTLAILEPASLLVGSAGGETGTSAVLRATLIRESDGSPVAGRQVAFQVGGVTPAWSPLTTGSDGVASHSYAIPAGSVPGVRAIQASFAGDSTFGPAVGSGELTVTSAPTTLEVTAPVAVAAGAFLRITSLLKQSSTDTPIAGRTITYQVNGLIAGAATTQADGTAETWFKVPASTPPGSVPVRADFAGDTLYNASRGDGTATVQGGVQTVLFVNSPSVGIGATATIYAYLWRVSDRALLSGKPVTFSVDGVKIGTVLTDTTGYAAVSYVVAPGTAAGLHSTMASFAGDADYGASGMVGTLTVSAAWSLVVSVPNRSGVRGQSVTLYAYAWRKYDGAMLAGKTVRFEVDGATVGSGVSDSGGYAQCVYAVPAGASIGTHPMRAVFDGDGQYDPTFSASSLTVTARDDITWFVANVTAAKGATATLYAYVKNKSTGALLSGKSITFKIDGSDVGSAISNSTGYAAVRFTVPGSMASGAHTILAAFAGDTAYNPSSKSATLNVP